MGRGPDPTAGKVPKFSLVVLVSQAYSVCARLETARKQAAITEAFFSDLDTLMNLAETW